MPAHERGGRSRQIRVRDRLQGREALPPELEERDQLVEVLQPMLAELREVTVHERPGGCGKDDLAAVAYGGDAGGAVELTPGVALAGLVQHSSVQPHPHLDGSGGERILTLPRSGERPDAVGEGV